MILLGDLPGLRIFGKGQSRSDVKFAGAAECEGETVLDEIARLVDRTQAEAVVVVQAFVEPDVNAPALGVDPELLSIDQPLGLLSRSSVTGLFLGTGAMIVPKGCISGNGALPDPVITLPYSVGRFKGHAFPEQAFENGYRSVAKVETPGTEHLRALAASLGTEALNGGWWVLGALSGLQPEMTLAQAWERHRRLLDTPNDTTREIEAEARRVRVATGLPVSALSHAESRALKAMLPNWPTQDHWQGFFMDCERFAPRLDGLVDRYRRAGGRIWTDMAEA